MEDNKERLFLVTNDDGIYAKGLKILIDLVKPLGKVFVIAPEESQSGMSHAITVKNPIRIRKIETSDNVTIFSCKGTPVDCVKLALNKLLDRHPDLILSGINHGSNSSTSIIYSATMAAAIEGCMNGIPSVGISLLDSSEDVEFDEILKYTKSIIYKVLEKGIPEGTCLNVNFPRNSVQPIRGIRICRQNKGVWVEEFDRRVDPQNREYFWLTGEFLNLEPDAEDTDEWALSHNYVAVVPVQIDLTSYPAIEYLVKHWFDTAD